MLHVLLVECAFMCAASCRCRQEGVWALRFGSQAILSLWNWSLPYFVSFTQSQPDERTGICSIIVSLALLWVHTGKELGIRVWQPSYALVVDEVLRKYIELLPIVGAHKWCILGGGNTASNALPQRPCPAARLPGLPGQPLQGQGARLHLCHALARHVTVVTCDVTHPLLSAAGH
jgi:hypothetical protein